MRTTIPFPHLAGLFATPLPIVLAMLPQAHAATITVGTPVASGQCNCATLQCAFDAADANDGPDTIRITRSLTYTAQNARLNVKAGEETIVEGGYATCDQPTPDAILTTLSGQGGSDDSVLELRIGTGGTARLRRLIITGGDDVSGFGGGIEYEGNGVLELSNIALNFNQAETGGGIYAHGTGSDAELVLGPNVTVFGNQAVSGGGLFVRRLEMTASSTGLLISGNSAFGVGGSGGGGGLYLAGRDGLPGIARISAPGALISGNEADHGGGVYLTGHCNNGPGGLDSAEGRLVVSSSDSSNPTALRNNTALVRGGGVEAHADNCGISYRGRSVVELRSDAELTGNVAPWGSAVYLDFDSEFAEPDVGAEFYASDALIQGNRSEASGGSVTDGAIVHAASATTVHFDRIELRDNQGGPLLRVDSNESEMGTRILRNMLVAGNVSLSSLFHTVDGDGSRLELHDSTLAGNIVGGPAVLVFTDNAVLRNLIIHQPGKVSLNQLEGTTAVTTVVASEGASLGAGPSANVYVGDPLFMDPDNGDFRLQAASPAVDRAESAGGRDVTGGTRDVDLPVVADVYGPRDVGAYERWSVGNLVRNSGFEEGRKFWATPAGQPDYTTILPEDATGIELQSALVRLDPNALPIGGTLPPDGRVLGATQCVRIPGAATYVMTALTKSPGTITTRDFARLQWRYHQNSADCSGSPTREGEILLPSGDAWKYSGMTPLGISPGEVGGNSALALTMIAAEGNISAGNPIDAWFDDVGVWVTDLEVPDIFADGLETPSP